MRRARPTGRIAVVGAALAAIILAGCLPVASPAVATYCAAATPTSAAGYQAAFDTLRQTPTGWVTGDGAVPVTLPDGRVAWLFGDTYTGRANTDGSISSADPYVHNSFVVQTGACFAPLLRGTAATRASLIPDPAPGQWYWPTAGVIDRGVLRVFVLHLQQGSGGAPGLQFSVVDTGVASFALPSLTLLDVQPLPFPTGPNRLYGATATTAPDGYVYAYGSTQGNAYAARTPVGSVPSGPWQFFSGSGWSNDPALAAPMSWPGVPPHLPSFGTGAGPVAQPWVVPYQGGYLLAAEPVDAFSSDVWAFTSSAPTGPWTYDGPIATSTVTAPAYGAAVRLNLPGATSPIVVFSTNNGMFSGAPPTINGYGPHFLAPSNLP